MRRMAAAGSLGLIWLVCNPALGQDEAPLLTAPVIDAPIPAELPSVLEAEPLAGEGPILAVPGLAIPGGPAPSIGLDPFSASELPPLVGPSGTPAYEPPARGSSPIGLEPFPDQAPGRLSPVEPPRGLDAARQGNLTPLKPSTSGRFRLFGRWQPPAFLRPKPAPKPTESIVIEPRADPAEDAALKRRIESQVRTAGGMRLRSYDVKVTGRQVSIHARVNRFWNRRTVQRALESLPALDGYRSTVEVVD